jgi:hypothetical protein
MSFPIESSDILKLGGSLIYAGLPNLSKLDNFITSRDLYLSQQPSLLYHLPHSLVTRRLLNTLWYKGT